MSHGNGSRGCSISVFREGKLEIPVNYKQLKNMFDPWMFGGVTLGVFAFQFVPEATTGDGYDWFRIVGAGAVAGIGAVVGRLIGRSVGR
jgi:hypothetical protein